MWPNAPPTTAHNIFVFPNPATREALGNEGYSDSSGSAFWNLVSRNGQEVVSGIYLYFVESRSDDFDRVVGRFVVVR